MRPSTTVKSSNNSRTSISKAMSKTAISTSIVTCGVIIAVAAGLVMPGWLTFLLTLALAKGLVVLGLLLLMRAGLVSFGQGLYYCLGGLLCRYCR